MPTILRAAPGDASVLSTLGRDTFTDTFGHLYDLRDLNCFLDTSHSVAVYTAMLSDPQAAAWIVRDGSGRAVGYACAGISTLPTKDAPASSGEVKRLYICRSAQGAGLGRWMLETALEWLGANGFSPIYLSVFSENTGAQRLYERYGFSKVGEYDYMVGNHADLEFIYCNAPGPGPDDGVRR